jgi:hypothetical protein
VHCPSPVGNGPDAQEEIDMEIAYLLVTLLCPVSMIAMVGWWAWAMRRPKQAPARSAADDAEITRMRAHLDQLGAHDRDGGAAIRL